MALQFNPPDWLIQEYLKQKSPAEQAAGGLNQALATYATLEQSQQANALKAAENARQEKELGLKTNELALKGREQFYNFGDVGALPLDQQQAILNPAQGPITEEGLPPQKPSLIQRFNEFLAQNPQGIKGREKLVQNRPQQVPNLINGKPAVFNPATGQYEIAQVIDPTAPSAPVVEDVKFTPRVEPPVTNQFVGTQDGKPVLFNPKTGQMSTGTLPGSGPLVSQTQTEGQANSRLYAQRMEESNKQLEQLSATTNLASVRSGIEGKMPNIAKSPNIQLYEQAKRNFLNAVLRRESGAVISPTEFAEGNKQYFEVMGDSPAVKKQKAINRQTAIEGLRNAAGMGPQVASAAGGPSGPHGPTVTQNGHTYTWNPEKRTYE